MKWKNEIETFLTLCSLVASESFIIIGSKDVFLPILIEHQTYEPQWTNETQIESENDFCM